MDIDFDALKRMANQPPIALTIAKMTIIDGAEIRVWPPVFAAAHVAHDPDNNDRPTLWYQDPTDAMWEALAKSGEGTVVHLRLFATGYNIDPEVHSHVGSYWDDGFLWHVYLDRTVSYQQEKEAKAKVVRETIAELNKVADQALGPVENKTPMSDDTAAFLKDLLKDLNIGEDE